MQDNKAIKMIHKLLSDKWNRLKNTHFQKCKAIDILYMRIEENMYEQQSPKIGMLTDLKLNIVGRFKEETQKVIEFKRFKWMK